MKPSQNVSPVPADPSEQDESPADESSEIESSGTSPLEILLSFQAQVRLLHWRNDSYAEHKAFGKLYSAMDEHIDSFVEASIGGTSLTEVIPHAPDIDTDLRADAGDVLSGFITYLKGDLTKQCSEMPDLLNIIAEMVKDTYTTIYLLNNL